MKAIPGRMIKALPFSTVVTCADNSGAKQLQIISVRGCKVRLRQRPSAGVGDQVTCRVYRGNEKVRHEVFKAVIIRQKKAWRRSNGMWVSFEDNAAVIVDDKFEPKGTLIKGPVAREIIERYPAVGKLAAMVV